MHFDLCVLCRNGLAGGQAAVWRWPAELLWLTVQLPGHSCPQLVCRILHLAILHHHHGGCQLSPALLHHERVRAHTHLLESYVPSFIGSEVIGPYLVLLLFFLLVSCFGWKSSCLRVLLSCLLSSCVLELGCIHCSFEVPDDWSCWLDSTGVFRNDLE